MTVAVKKLLTSHVEDTIKRSGLWQLLEDKEFLGDALEFASQKTGKVEVHQFSPLQAIDVLVPYLDGQPKVKEKIKALLKQEERDPVLLGFATLIILRGVHKKMLIFWED